jgi:hypothetical protein
MKKKLVIYLVLTKVRKFDLKRFDAKEIEKSKKLDFEFHEIQDFVHPGFTNVFTAKRWINKKNKIFSSFNNWKKEIKNKKKIYKENLIVYNCINITNFKSFRVNHFLFKEKIKTLVASDYDHPLYSSNNWINRFKILFKSLLFNNKKIYLFIQNYFFYNLGKILNIKPDFFLKCGSAYSAHENKTGIRILKGHSRDYNMFIKSKKKNFKRKDKFGLFLESVTPIHNIGDKFISGDNKNMMGTAEKWLNSLNNFFLQLEKTLKIKILIVPHPKIIHKKKYSKLYHGREILNEKLSVVAKKCELIISRDSTGFSFAAIYNKPAIFMYNNELKQLNDNFINNQKKFAQELGLTPVNIDNSFTNKKIFKLKNFNKSIYLNYVKKYLSFRNDEKLNYQVIEECIK